MRLLDVLYALAEGEFTPGTNIETEEGVTFLVLSKTKFQVSIGDKSRVLKLLSEADKEVG